MSSKTLFSRELNLLSYLRECMQKTIRKAEAEEIQSSRTLAQNMLEKQETMKGEAPYHNDILDLQSNCGHWFYAYIDFVRLNHNLGKESKDVSLKLKESKEFGTNCDLEMLPKGSHISMAKTINVSNEFQAYYSFML